MAYYNKYEDVPEHYRKHLDTFDLTDKQKVECLNSLSGIVESIFDRALGMGILSSVGNFFGGFFADGGKLKPGQFGVVGERGPELAFAGNSPLNILPNQAMAGGAPITINMSVQTPDIRSFRQSQSQIAADMARQMERARRNL